MKAAIHSQNIHSGFSLIEMLMTLSILGIMTSLALAWFGGDVGAVRQARDQRNAQTLCTLCQSVEAAGINLAAEESTALDVLRRLVEGVTIQKGALKGRTFQLPGLGKEELEAASRYITIQDGQVRYEPNGQVTPGQTPSGEQI
ncbi:type II secretion system protein [Prosthecobacter algae]